MRSTLIVLLAIATVAYSQVATPGAPCHACGYCSNVASPWNFDYDWSNFGNTTLNNAGGAIVFMSSPCGRSSGLTTYQLPAFPNGTSCNASTHLCYCTPDFRNTVGNVCFAYGYNPSWSIINHNTVVMHSENPDRCLFSSSSNKSYEVTTIFACDRLVKGRTTVYTELQASDAFRTEYCTASPTDYCSRCMLWLTPAACKDPATLNITSVTWDASTRVLNVSFTAENVIPQIGTEAAYTLFINNQQWGTNYQTTNIVVTLPASYGEGGIVTVRMLVFADTFFGADNLDASPSYSYGTPETTAAAGNSAAVFGASIALVLMCLFALLL